MEIDKSGMKDSMEKLRTQSLFLEVGYTDSSIYTLKDNDHEHKGRVYPSLKRLYLAHEDPTEYDFAVTYLLGWNHWQRICDNAILGKHVNQWREELELKIRSQGIRDIMDMSADGSYQASKFLADRGWDKRAVGRPSKAEKEREANMQKSLDDDFSADVSRMKDYRK